MILIVEYLKESKTTLFPSLYLGTIQFSLAEEFINKFKISNSWNYVESVSYNSICTSSANMLMIIAYSIDFNYPDAKCSGPWDEQQF